MSVKFYKRRVVLKSMGAAAVTGLSSRLSWGSWEQSKANKTSNISKSKLNTTAQHSYDSRGTQDFN